jgi:neutral ceramidase
MTNLTRRDFVLAAAGGLGAAASSRLHAAQTAGPGEKAGAATGSQSGRNAPQSVRAASASVKLTDDNMTELSAETKVFAQPWEGEFRANAMVLDAEQRICLVSLDSLIVPLHVTRSAANRIAAATGIPVDNILLCATHTHRGPATNDAFGGKPNAEYLRRLEEGSVRAAVKAVAAMEDGKSDATAVLFGQSQEATVGRNSRLLLKDASIGWDGYEEQDAVRPTGPYDPDLYVLALRRADGKYGGLAFNHSVHNIGHIREDCMSPCFYGLAALEVERRHNATTLFLPGAFGSTHNITYNNSGVPAAECVHRVVDAVEEALGRLQPALPGPVQVLNRQFTYHVRCFDEAKEALAVKSYLEKYVPERTPHQIEMFRRMRREMALHQGEARHTRLQIIRLGDIALVGIPGEMFGRLGLELRRRSPFRHTCIIGLANEQIGYIPDRKAYADGGYQTWVGWHSMLEVGTGEAMVDEVVAMLDGLYDAAPPQRRSTS